MSFRTNKIRALLRWAKISVVLVTGFGVGLGGDVRAGPTSREGDVDEGFGIVTWKELRFRAEKFFLSAQTVTTVDQGIREDRIRAELREPPADLPSGLTATDGRVTKLSLVTHLPFGRNEEASVWIDSMSGAVIQGEKRTFGGWPYWKLWRHGVGSLVQWRTGPLKQERGLPMDRWSKRKVETKALPTAPDISVVVIDPYALVYLVSAGGLGEITVKLTRARMAL